jgi:hypothetical protein
MAQIWLAEFQHFLPMKCVTTTAAEADGDIHDEKHIVRRPFASCVRCS